MNVTPLGAGTYVVTDDETGQRHVVYVAGVGGGDWAFLDGRVYRRGVEAESQRPSAEVRGDVGAIAAPMPGTVRQVRVAAGQKVAKGDTLIVLEAMKMELPLRALDEGTVSAVRCREGELVQADAVLVEFVPS